MVLNFEGERTCQNVDFMQVTVKACKCIKYLSISKLTAVPYAATKMSSVKCQEAVVVKL